MRQKLCLLPSFRADATGGVARHVLALEKHLAGRGWELVARPEPDALVHVHAAESAPEVDVYTNHGIHPVVAEMPDWQARQNRQILYNLRTAREVIAVSSWTAGQWQERLGIAPQIIGNGVDLDEWAAVPRGTWRRRLGIGPRTPLVLWGKTTISELCDPAPALELALRFPESVVVLTVKPGALLFPPKNVRLVGPQPFESMKRLLADCDVYLATTLENHSVQVLEAMALGKAVLGYGWGGTAETIADGETGVLVPPGRFDLLAEGFCYALAQGARLGDAAQATVAEHYQWHDLVDRLEVVYERALAAKTAEAYTPKCSIVIPCYNKAAYVAETLESAAAQAGVGAYEVIVVDDGSTDGSDQVIHETIVRLEHERPGVLWTQVGGANHGVAHARNAGIGYARGRYVACLDADDRIDPLFLQRLSAALDADPGLGIAYPDFIAFDEGGQWPVQCDEFAFERLVKGNLLPCGNLFRKSAWRTVGGYKDINPSWEDYELWLNITKRGWGARRVPGPLFWYRKVTTGRDAESHGQEFRLRATVNRHHRDIYPPLVSVVIPCYGQAQFLREAIDSALGQTFPDLEVVVVDDGNPEAEAAAIEAIVVGYGNPDVCLVRNRENLGLAGARNAGIRTARGQWIVPLDADDRLPEGYVDSALKASGLDPQVFVFGDTVWWWPETGRIELRPAEEYDPAKLLRHISWMCSILYHKGAWEAAGGYKREMSAAGGFEDWEFCISLAEQGIQGRRLAGPGLYYRQYDDGQMRRTAEQRHPALREAMRRLHPDTFRGERQLAPAEEKTR